MRPPEWLITDNQIEYQTALLKMEARVEQILNQELPELIWLLEHPHLYTAGSSALKNELLDPNKAPVFTSGRGGKYTYHGPGQRIIYIMLNLKERYGNIPDIRLFIQNLEKWIINSLAHFDINCEIKEDKIGLWVGQEKIAAIGIRIKKGITYHGIAINIAPDLSYFSGIIPCGIQGFGVTSMQKLGKDIPPLLLDNVLKEEFFKIF